jgi:hypothetical protein
MIACITPTGARQAQINLCQTWMQNQTYTGKVVWVIVDDAYPRTIENITRPGWEVVKVYPDFIWQSGQNTQARNIAAGINTVLKYSDIEGIFIIEDDDYYKPVYLERMVLQLKGFWATGERHTIYYNVVTRRYVTNPNNFHSSLFQTAFTVEAIPEFENSLWHRFIDCEFWRNVKNGNLFNEGNLAVGMKGMPGRGGIGAGHKLAMNMMNDPDWSYLKSLIGEDYEHYKRYYRDFGNSQHTFFNKRSI